MEGVYLDYNATTPLASEVVQAISESLTQSWGNPSSSHIAGVSAKNTITTARTHVANMIGANPPDIIFTSGGTEGNNWILHIAKQQFQKQLSLKDQQTGDNNVCLNRPHFITSNIEHDSIKLVLDHYKAEGLADVTEVPVRHSTGAVHVDDVLAAIRPTTVLITIMLANNETGVIQPISAVSQKVKSLKRQKGETEKIFIHTDAAQAIGKIPVNVKELGVDYLTIVGHKFYGPRIGAIYVKNPSETTPLYPMFFGGGQERNFSTENTPMIAGLGKAAELVYKNLQHYQSHMLDVRDYLEQRLKEIFGEHVIFNGKTNKSDRLPNTCNVSFVGPDMMKGHEILSSLTSIQASVGAACHAQDRPSHILLATGATEFAAFRALRISVGRETTKDDIDFAVKELQSLLIQK
ncbi:selenocysteine lyase-like isoform X2 [Physella acuta]|uniref:selenocysteine lyase-like isoform X2 n=1 Tax=Physella acuta TaxID=109671 RepID=UPI0027DE2593|nr:selenocysteine lyase-like isoform X2 [Physella acuta]